MDTAGQTDGWTEATALPPMMSTHQAINDHNGNINNAKPGSYSAATLLSWYHADD